MSASDEGGFDLVMEVAQQLLLDVAQGIQIPAVTTPFSFAGISGNFTLAAALDSVALGTFPQINVSVNMMGTTIDATSVPSFLNPVPANLRTINLLGDVSVPVPLSVSGSALVADFTQAGTPTVSQDVFDSILAAPLIQFLLAESILLDPTGGLYNQTVQTIKTAVAQQIQSNVSNLGAQTLIDFSSLSATLASAIGTGVNGFTFSFGNQSIFLLFTLGGSGGNASLITRSDLLRASDGLPADRADLILSNACLLRDFIKPVLMRPPGAAGTAGLGLTASGFLPGSGPSPGSPIFWVGSVPFPSVVGGAIASASITGVIVGIDGTNLRILINASAGGILGSFSVTASIDITVALSLTISAGNLTLTFTPIGTPVVSSNVSIAWWVYVVGFAIGGIEVDVLIAVANAFGGTIANGIVTGALSGGFGPFSFSAPLPPNIPVLSVRQLSLFQADAPPTLVSIGMFVFPVPFPQNDVIVNLI